MVKVIGHIDLNGSNPNAWDSFRHKLSEELQAKNGKEMPLGIFLAKLPPGLKQSVKKEFPEYAIPNKDYNWHNLIAAKIPGFKIWRDEEKGDMVAIDTLSSPSSPTNQDNYSPGIQIPQTEKDNSTEIVHDKIATKRDNNSMRQEDISALVKEIIEGLNVGLYEKEKSIRMTLLATLAGESTFMLGEPGTAKSLVARRISEAFEEPDKNSGFVKFFDYLMNQFSQPDEIFGPVSINELKNDRYIRKTEGFLPKAQFAFLDEIWKANPAIQNTLLTILNEKIFRNGTQIEKVPLIGFMSASNELPEQGAGLDAIFDRFLVRLLEKPIGDEDKFRQMVSAGRNLSATINNKISQELIGYIQNESEKVTISEECYDIISDIRKALTNKNEEIEDEKEKFIISDRRWKKIVNLMRVSAYCNNRLETDIMDATLIADCIWSTIQQEEEAKQIVLYAIERHGLKYNDVSSEINKEIDDFTNSISNTFFDKQPKKQKIRNNIYLQAKDGEKDVYISQEKLRGEWDNFYLSDNLSEYGRPVSGSYVKDHTIFTDGKKNYIIKQVLIPKEFAGSEIREAFIESVNKKLYTPIQEKIERSLKDINEKINSCRQQLGNNIFSDNNRYFPIISEKLTDAKTNIQKQKKRLEKEKERYENQ